VTSISALVKLVESGFGLATLPKVAVNELRLHHAIVPVNTVLRLVPLPLFASYLSPAATPEIDESISHALTFMRDATSKMRQARAAETGSTTTW